jgi:CheY-like chemotaxis protein
MMERQVNHMVRLVDDLLEVSRITRGKIELRKEPIEVAAVVRTAVETSRPLIEAAGGGLGIGLTLVKSLVELHGGSVTVTSDGPGCGSEFVVHLPLAPASAPTTPVAGKERPASVLPPRQVLVVDDNRDAAQSLGMLLRVLGADVRVAFSGPEALSAIAARRPDVVLLDIGMPGMDGHEVAREIRQQPDLAHVTLIALTGWGQEEDRRKSESAGFDFHLTKPADMSALQTLLLSLEGKQDGGGSPL